MRSRKLWSAAEVAVAIAAADQLVKLLVRHEADRLPAMAFRGVGLQISYNTGVSFGRLQGGGWVLFAAVTGVIVVLCVLAWRLPERYTIPIALIVGGAAGNQIDRLRFGAVLDFFVIGPWPNFNLGDVAIVGGAALVAWRALRGDGAGGARA